jgi:hypothetical protein
MMAGDAISRVGRQRLERGMKTIWKYVIDEVAGREMAVERRGVIVASSNQEDIMRKLHMDNS